MFYDNFRLNNRNYTLANVDFNHIRIERMIEMQDLRQEVQRARKEAADLRETLSEGQDSTRSLQRNVASLERDLCNARAKIKRLEGKQRGKPLADEQWSEYIDDM